MSMQDALQQEQSPADLLAIDHKEAVNKLITRAPELVKQLQATPDALIALAKQIEALEPLPLVPELPAETPYPTEALLNMDGAVFEISNRLKVSPALVGQCALGLANGIIQGLADIVKPANPNPKPTSLFLLAGAESGEGKTLVDDILSSKLHDFSIEKDLSYQVKREDYDLSMKAYHCEVKKIENSKDLDQSDREQAFRELKKPVLPMNPRLKASDVTIEGLARQFREGCTRLSLMTDEGALLFSNHTLQNERRSAVMGRLCKLWDGGQWDIPEFKSSFKNMLVLKWAASL
ncbi:YfjI family protein, partial [Endozoicomonas sp. ONNA2]|uniref:YfjI family protein n=1 Tax=Endozoicomonas sp. ONNA2 TaxID=2828741 RepID=UPI002148F3B1